MVERVAERLARGVRGWMALGAVLLFVLFAAMVLPAQVEAGAFYTVRHAAPDTSLWYFPEDLYAAAEAWGRDGRAAYVHARVTFDVIWPMVYGTLLLTTLAWSTVFTTGAIRSHGSSTTFRFPFTIFSSNSSLPM